MRAFLIHGLNNNHASLLGVTSMFQRMGLSSEIFPISGHHLHQKSNLDYCTWNHWEEDFQHLANIIMKQNESVVLFGFSLGALIIAKCLQDHTEIHSKIHKLIYFSPAFARRSYTSSTGVLRRLWPSGVIPSSTPKQWRQHAFCSFSAYHSLNDGFKSFHQKLEYLNKHDKPTLQKINNITTHILIDPRDICVSSNMILKIKQQFYSNWNLQRVYLKSLKSLPSFHTSFDSSCFMEADWHDIWLNISK